MFFVGFGILGYFFRLGDGVFFYRRVKGWFYFFLLYYIVVMYDFFWSYYGVTEVVGIGFSGYIGVGVI